jgi:peptidoglycan/LPS O-acetylase OafA/YrhL
VGSDISKVDTNWFSSRSTALDLLRIFACLWVWIFHWSSDGNIWTGSEFHNASVPSAFPKLSVPIAISSVVSIGFLGVSIFFILSGTVIAKTALTRTAPLFLMARINRLLPPIFLASIFTIAANLVQPRLSASRVKYDILQGIINATGIPLISAISGGGHSFYIGDTWTLPIEILFYLIVALSILLFGQLDSKKLLQTTIVISFVLVFVRNEIPVGYSFLFIYGILLFCADSIYKFVRLAPVILIAGYFTTQKIYVISNPHIFIENHYKSWIFSTIFTILVGLVILYRNTIQKLTKKQSDIIRILSLMTFPFYLLHETFGLLLVNLLFHYHCPLNVAYLTSFLTVTAISLYSVKSFEPYSRHAITSILSRITLWGGNT